MSSRLSNLKLPGEEEDLRYLLEKYLERAEELENRENKVLRQIELMQTAVSSLQNWNQSRKASRSSSEPVMLNIKEIEEETRLIREETKRIETEIQEKIEENKILEEEVRRRKTQESDDFRLGMDSGPASATKEDDVVHFRKMEESSSPERDSEPGTNFFDGKLKKLKLMERQFVKESEMRSGELKKKQQDLKDKVEMLEWESRIDKQLIETLRKKSEKK